MTAIFALFRRVAHLLHRDRFDKILGALAIILVCGVIGISYFEPELSFADAVWSTLVTVTTVGYGDIYPASVGGRIVGVFLMLFGIGFLGLLTATLASTFVEDRRREGKGMKAITHKDHFLICGWNFKAKEIIEEIRADEKARRSPIVLLADPHENPLENEEVHFVSGVVDPDTLRKANAGMALAAIVLADEQVEVHTRDAKTILDTLTIKTTFPDLYTCVELVDRNNIAHCKMAKADEIVVTGAMSTNLLVQAAFDHGITHLISELVSTRYGNAMYKITGPAACKEIPFIDALTLLKRDLNLILVAIESFEEHTFLANPRNDYIINADDQLIVIARERPAIN